MPEGKPFINTGLLLDQKEAYSYSAEIEKLFIASINEALSWHISHCTDYKKFLEQNGFFQKKIESLQEYIPPISIDVLNKYPLISVPNKQIKFEVATNDKKLLLDARSHKRLLKIFDNIFSSMGLTDYNQKVNYLCFTYDSKFVNNYDNSNFFFDMITDLTAHRSVYYAIRYNKNSNNFFFDSELAAKKLIDFSCHSEPIRIIGKQSYLFQIIEWLDKNNLNLKLPKNSYIFILEDYSKNDFFEEYKTIYKKSLDIPFENIRKIFILPELGIPFISCSCGEFHVPIYANASVVEPESLTNVDDEQAGLLTLISPYLTGYPGIALLTNYMAVIRNNCSCNFNSKTFKILNNYEYN